MIFALDRPAQHSPNDHVVRDGVSLTLLFSRTEPRIPKSILVRLFDPEKREFEISLTVDVSDHGALVVCKNPLPPNTYISVHSMGRSMYSPARVVHCQPLKDRSYALGLELADPLPDWLEIQRSARQTGKR